MKVLIADDNDDVRESLKIVLQLKGCEVFLACESDHAWLHVANNRPDAVIVDYLMPGMTGIELARKMREDPKFANVPVALTSGLPSDRFESVKAHAASLNRVRCFQKPFNPCEVFDWFKSVLGLKAQSLCGG